MSKLPTSNSEPANRFKDLSGREWVLELNRGKMLRIRAELDVDLGDVEQLGRTVAKLLHDDDLLVDVLWATLADRAGDVTLADFNEQLDGETIEAAKDALIEAVYFFTQPGKRALMRKATTALMETYRKAIAEAETRVEKAMRDATERASNRLGTSATRSPGSLGISTTPGRSARRKSR